MSSIDDKAERNCIITGKCQLHDIEIERRKSAAKEVQIIRDSLDRCKLSSVTKFEALDVRIRVIGNKVAALFLSLGLLLVITGGGYYYTQVIDLRIDRSEQRLLTRMMSDTKDAKAERLTLVSQVVELLTADAERREWQRGMMSQLQLLNAHIRDIMKLSHPELKLTTESQDSWIKDRNKK